jgi:hypothetical protein
MLKDRASDFYYNSIIGKTTDFDTIVAITRTHFKTKEQKTQLRVRDRRVLSVGFGGRGGLCAPHKHLLDATAHASPRIKTIKLSLKK